MIKYTYLLLFILLSTTSLFAQVGTPPITGFAPNDYDGAPDIRAVIQSKRGFLYASSTGGNILEYDGISWKKIAVPCGYVNSLVEDNNGNIFFGDMFFSCAAYLRPNLITGKWEVMPIDFNLPDSISLKNNFRTRVKKVDGQIYYILSNAKGLKNIPLVYKFQNGKLMPLPITSSNPRNVNIFFKNKNILKIKEKGKVDVYDANGKAKGTLQMSFDIPASALYQIENYTKDEFLFLTVSDNLWKYNLKTKETNSFLSPQTREIMKLAQPLNFNILQNGNLIIGTIKKGVFIIDENGKILKNISTTEGLRDDIVMATTADYQNQLWTALYNGISRIDINAPLGIWTKENGVVGGTTLGVIKFQGTYFAATITNVVYFDTKQNTWKPVKGTNIENYIAGVITLSDKKDHLFIGQISGLDEVVKDEKGVWKIKKVVKKNTTLRIRKVFNHSTNPNKMYIWGATGLQYINYDSLQNELKTVESLKGIQIQSDAPVQQINNSIWTIEANKERPIRIDIPSEKVTLLPYDTTFISHLNGQTILFKNNLDSIFSLNNQNKKVYNRELTEVMKAYKNQTINIQQDSLGSLWVFELQNAFVHVLRKTKNGYKRDNLLEQSLGKYRLREVYSDVDNKQIVWVSTTEGILKVDMARSEIEKKNNTNFYTYIRQIKVGKDSLVFDGNFSQVKKMGNDSAQHIILANQPKNHVLELNYIDNSIIFQVAAPFFIEEKQIQFAYLLEGMSNKWSEWTNLNIKEYNNLKEGEYTLRVKAKNYLGKESLPTSYRFKILPPWHRTTTAYILYIIFGVGIIFGSSRIYTHRLRQQNEQLESIVAERTDQLSQKNTELSTQNEEIVQQRDQLNIKNQHIAEQNKNIVSSINYAKRIQTALLPIEKRIKQEIPEHFIFYKPRDIVSGDFYWIEKIENKLIIAISDCTGHGVPGAFMSMLGSSGLTDAVFQQNLTQPDLILTHLHNYIYSALKQNQSDNRDGMDICIIVWDKSKKQIQYAGAMNPLYYVQNEEFFQIKADKIPVGGTIAKERIYTPHTINLHVPTTIYLASDGYQDQFGGENNRKFMTKKFRELLLEISHLPIKEQEKRIAQVFERWKGKTHQIDDVLVMGMKIG